MNDLFIQNKKDISREEPEYKFCAERDVLDLISRWNSPEGQGKLASILSTDLSKEALQSFGKYNGQIDLRGIPLSGNTFTKMNLNHIDFYSADLSGCHFSECNMENCWLSEANIKDTKFEWCNMQGVLIDTPQFNENTTFQGINLSQINFTLAVLLQDLAEDQRRIQYIETNSPLLARTLKYTCNYGRSLKRWFIWVLSVIAIFALIFQFTHTGAASFFDALYFSFVTFTTLGYGDIVPLSIAAKVFVILETLLGYLMGGLLVAILARKVMGR